MPNDNFISSSVNKRINNITKTLIIGISEQQSCSSRFILCYYSKIPEPSSQIAHLCLVRILYRYPQVFARKVFSDLELLWTVAYPSSDGFIQCLCGSAPNGAVPNHILGRQVYPFVRTTHLYSQQQLCLPVVRETILKYQNLNTSSVINTIQKLHLDTT